MRSDGGAREGLGLGDQELSDRELMDTLRQMWATRDPEPADLAERIVFTLSVDDLDGELMRLSEELLTAAGARAEEQARTVTFSSESLSVMVTISPVRAAVRLDGWISEGGGLRVGLRAADGERTIDSDGDGRFAFEDVGPGLVQLVFHPCDGAVPTLHRPVVTPAFQV